MARWASFIDRRKDETPVLLLDTGDFFGPEVSDNDGIDYRYFFEGMGLLGYDAVNIGPNDLLSGRNALRDAAERGSLPLVSSNIIDSRGGGPATEPFLIRYLGGRRTLFGRKGGVRVGIFGITDPSFFDIADTSFLEGYTIKEPRITALETVSTLRGKGCDLIIALSHLGWDRSVRLASDVPGIDIVVNGHREHEGTFQQRSGPALVVDTGVHRISFTEIEARFLKGRLFLRAVDMGAAAREMPRRADLEKLESRYVNELEKMGKQDRRENAVEAEKDN